MNTLFLITAAIGCTVLVAQVGLQLLGLGADAMTGDVGPADVDIPDGESNIFFGVLSFKTLSAFVAFFGLGGLAAEEAGVASGMLQVLIAIGVGLVAAAVVVVLMRMLFSLNVSGTSRLTDAVGKNGRVLLSVPANDGGRGRVVVDIGGREIEVFATTQDAEIPTGSSVEVVRHTEGETFEVRRL